jgi:hypothetical protein
VKILDTTGTRTPILGRPPRSQSLYRLRYPCSSYYIYHIKCILIVLNSLIIIYIYIYFELTSYYFLIHFPCFLHYSVSVVLLLVTCAETEDLRHRPRTVSPELSPYVIYINIKMLSAHTEQTDRVRDKLRKALIFDSSLLWRPESL